MARRVLVALLLAVSVVASACDGAQLNAFRLSKGLPPLPADQAERAAAAITSTLGQAARRASFVATAQPVGAAELGASWRQGCPVGPESLVRLTMSIVRLDGSIGTGDLVVARAVALTMIAAFRDLFVAGFPIDRMVPIAAYQGDDEASMAADDTSAFNCRPVAGTTNWSMHAFGEAVDVNPLINPSVDATTVDPPAGAAHADRSVPEPGKITSGSVAVQSFARYGWSWGGTWSSPDYQHFSTNGR
jgi:hypothetical protein